MFAEHMLDLCALKIGISYKVKRCAYFTFFQVVSGIDQLIFWTFLTKHLVDH
jgi:hypothetical protein